MSVRGSDIGASNVSSVRRIPKATPDGLPIVAGTLPSSRLDATRVLNRPAQVDALVPRQISSQRPCKGATSNRSTVSKRDFGIDLEIGFLPAPLAKRTPLACNTLLQSLKPSAHGKTAYIRRQSTASSACAVTKTFDRPPFRGGCAVHCGPAVTKTVGHGCRGRQCDTPTMRPAMAPP